MSSPIFLRNPQGRKPPKRIEWPFFPLEHSSSNSIYASTPSFLGPESIHSFKNLLFVWPSHPSQSFCLYPYFTMSPNKHHIPFANLICPPPRVVQKGRPCSPFVTLPPGPIIYYHAHPNGLSNDLTDYYWVDGPAKLEDGRHYRLKLAASSSLPMPVGILSKESRSIWSIQSGVTTYEAYSLDDDHPVIIQVPHFLTRKWKACKQSVKMWWGDFVDYLSDLSIRTATPPPASPLPLISAVDFT